MADFSKSSTKYLLFTCAVILLISVSLPVSLAETEGTPKYVGSLACKPCHEKEYKSFVTYAKKSTSFRSIERLEKELTEKEIKGCYHCHTTGYGKPGGFISPEKTPHLKNAGCEVCHGPGEFHVKKRDPSYIKRHLTAKDCEVCHTSERVRAFRYKPLIHGGAH
ncbi:MAG: cytochrome C [Deltaproteobacteria bacterium]|nr:MAG: cytochrome C [Deltaproteobacteria bacterium]RLC08292.1 MAG: cytochrome C [Deltaproteobacteria bacterium]